MYICIINQNTFDKLDKSFYWNFHPISQCDTLLIEAPLSIWLVISIFGPGLLYSSNSVLYEQKWLMDQSRTENIFTNSFVWNQFRISAVVLLFYHRSAIQYIQTVQFSAGIWPVLSVNDDTYTVSHFNPGIKMFQK